MTVIAWDGKTLAADKQSTQANMARTVTKIYRVPNGMIGICGSAVHGMELLEWFRNGRQRDKFPFPKSKDEIAHVLYIDLETVAIYNGETGPFPEYCESPFIAAGSGRDYAMAAMHLGKSAREAVEVACHFDVTCGMGVDTLDLIEERQP